MAAENEEEGAAEEKYVLKYVYNVVRLLVLLTRIILRLTKVIH